MALSHQAFGQLAVLVLVFNVRDYFRIQNQPAAVVARIFVVEDLP